MMRLRRWWRSLFESDPETYHALCELFRSLDEGERTMCLRRREPRLGDWLGLFLCGIAVSGKPRMFLRLL